MMDIILPFVACNSLFVFVLKLPLTLFSPIDRYTLCSMVKKISVYENHRIEIEFYYTDQYRIMREVNKRIKDEQKKNCLAERSA